MNKLFIFSLGAAIGSLLTWKLLEEKYKRLADEEIKSVVERFKNKEENCKEDKDKEEPIKDIRDYEIKQNSKDKRRTYYTDKLQNLGYDIDKDDNMSITEEEDGSIWVGPGEDYIDPYAISPEEFGEIESYETKSWTYYSDHIITNEFGEIVDEPEAFIGDNLIHFSEYEDDSLHVRNENIECDYEIIKYDGAFSELNGRTMNDVSTRSQE